MSKLVVLDTTLRDGEQSPGVNLNKREKLQIAKQLERFGVDVLEAGFAASSRGDFESIELIAKEIRSLSICSLSRALIRDIDTSWDALKHAADPRLHIFLATSKIHMEHKLRMSEQDVLDTIYKTVKHARSFFPVVQVSAEDAGRSTKEFLVKFSNAAINAGAQVINIPDTVGYSTPEEYGELFKFLRENVDTKADTIFSCHCHNDLGMAVGNSLAAIRAGVEQVEGTINGIGERAGNAALEEIAVALHIRKDLFNRTTNLNLREIKQTSTLVSRLTGLAVQKNKAIVGANAFAHESGIHQDGVLKESTTYEIISPSLVGVERNNLVLGKHSGRHAFTERLQELGYDLTKEESDHVFKEFKRLADLKKDIVDDDLHALVLGEKVSGKNKYEFSELNVAFNSNSIQTATVSIKLENDQVVQDAATGKGSIEAIYNAIERIINLSCHLEDYRIQSISHGEDALAQVNVILSNNAKKYTGFGIANDVLEASAKAYLYAANKVQKEVAVTQV
ncbi:MAG: 2-isopropylmalate synthase [Bacillales bacterium]|jgi:2-isopropylmalate synthase|nr:2-isopropylmalate synthase [Bacillales bacterium]